MTLKPIAIVCSLLCTLSPVKGSGLLELLTEYNPNQSAWFKQTGLQLGGWLNAGISINPDQPRDHFNGAVGFSDRANELQFNQLYWFLERDISQDSRQWSWGGRLDFVFGSDAFYTRAMGDPSDHWDSHLLHQRIYGIALPQAYLDVSIPIGRGLRFKIGEFYTLLGNESVMAPDNFFYSRSYAMQFGEPFSHAGVLANYALSDSVDLTAGAVTGSPFAGWDGGFQHRLENWGFVGGINVKWPKTASSLALSGSHGSLSEVSGQDVNLYSVVFKQTVGEHWHYTLQHDYGWTNNVEGNSGAQWYGVVGYLTHEVSRQLGLGLRLEWFRDDDGTRVGLPARKPTSTGHAANYYAATVGANWKPRPWLNLRPSVRYDISDGWSAFDAGQSERQLLVSADVIVTF